MTRYHHAWHRFSTMLAGNLDYHLYHYVILIYLAGGALSAIGSMALGLNKQHVGIALIIGALLPYLLFYRAREAHPTSRAGSGLYYKVALAAFLSLTLLAIGINYVQEGYVVSEYYFLIVAVQAGLILLQITAPGQRTRVETALILAEIFILSATLYTVFTFLFPGYYGNDSTYHTGFITDILKTGYLSEYTYAEYTIFPLYEIILAELSALCLIDIKLALLAFSIMQLTFVLFIYAVCNKLLNGQIGLIAALLFSLSTYSLISKYSFYPGGTAAIFFVFFIFLLVCMDLKPHFKLLFVLLILASNFFHPMLPFFQLVALAVFYLVSRLSHGVSSKLYLELIIIYALAILTQWTRPFLGVPAGLFAWVVMTIYGSIFKVRSVTQATLAPLYNWTDIILYDLGYTILIALAVAGAIFVLNRRRFKIPAQQKAKLTTLSLILLLLVPLPYVLGILAPNSLPNRWFPFIEALAAIFAALTLFSLISSNRGAIRALTVILVPALVFLCITSPVSNPNEDLYSQALSHRTSITWSEQSCIEFIKSATDPNLLYGNSVFMNFVGGYGYNLRPTDPLPSNKNFVIRDYDLQMGFTTPTYGARGLILEVLPADDAFVRSLGSLNQFYDDGTTRMFSS